MMPPSRAIAAGTTSAITLSLVSHSREAMTATAASSHSGNAYTTTPTASSTIARLSSGCRTTVLSSSLSQPGSTDGPAAGGPSPSPSGSLSSGSLPSSSRCPQPHHNGRPSGPDQTGRRTFDRSQGNPSGADRRGVSRSGRRLSHARRSPAPGAGPAGTPTADPAPSSTVPASALEPAVADRTDPGRTPPDPAAPDRTEPDLVSRAPAAPDSAGPGPASPGPAGPEPVDPGSAGPALPATPPGRAVPFRFPGSSARVTSRTLPPTDPPASSRGQVSPG